MKCLTIALVILGFCIGDTFGKNIVSLVNRLPGNQLVKYQCHSKYEPYVPGFLHPKDPPQTWRFNDAFIIGTKIMCKIFSGKRWKRSADFKVYDTSWKRGNGNTDNVTWVIAKTGFYRVFNNAPPELWVKWKDPPVM